MNNYFVEDFENIEIKSFDNNIKVKNIYNESSESESDSQFYDNFMKIFGGAPITSKKEEADNKIGSADFVFEVKSKLSEYSRDLLMIPILHELGFYMSVQKGVNADKPKGVPFSVTFKEPYIGK